MKNISYFSENDFDIIITFFSAGVNAATVFSFGCVNASQQFFFDRTVYSSTVTLVLKGAAGGGISDCSGKSF